MNWRILKELVITAIDMSKSMQDHAGSLRRLRSLELDLDTSKALRERRLVLLPLTGTEAQTLHELLDNLEPLQQVSDLGLISPNPASYSKFQAGHQKVVDPQLVWIRNRLLSILEDKS